MKLNAKELRDIETSSARDHAVTVRRNPIYLILENVYDTYNIGGLFRLADALAIEKIFLCGQMETPPNGRIAKASIGTYKIVPWEYKASAVEVIEELRTITDSRLQITEKNLPEIRNQKSEIKIIAVEQSKDSKNYAKVDYSLPVALVVGNETFGVSEETLKAVDEIVEIPMWGINKSLNVIVSAAIVAYHIMSKQNLS